MRNEVSGGQQESVVQAGVIGFRDAAAGGCLGAENALRRLPRPGTGEADA